MVSFPFCLFFLKLDCFLKGSLPLKPLHTTKLEVGVNFLFSLVAVLKKYSPFLKILISLKCLNFLCWTNSTTTWLFLIQWKLAPFLSTLRYNLEKFHHSVRSLVSHFQWSFFPLPWSSFRSNLKTSRTVRPHPRLQRKNRTESCRKREVI